MTQPKEKPTKPYKDFPLFPHNNGQWAKKIRGKLYYFGAWSDPDEAARFYLRVRDDLYAGRSPDVGGLITLRQLANEFLDFKQQQADADQITLGLRKEYTRSCKRMLTILDGHLDASQLKPQDFAALRAGLVKACKSPKTLQNELTRLKVLFRWAFESGAVGAPLPYALAMKPPAARLLRLAKAAKRRDFSADEIRLLIQHSDGYMVPAIYLGINLGMGNRDVCELQWKHIINGKHLNFPRPKTGVTRQAVLWPETVSALALWRSDSVESQWVCCNENGNQLVDLSGNTPIAHQFRVLMTLAGIDVDAEGGPVKTGRGFYGLRHTYRTVADEQGDQPAIMLTMGHADNSMSGTYRQRISTERIAAIEAYNMVTQGSGRWSEYGLPNTLYGLEVVVEDAVMVTTPKGAATQTEEYVMPSGVAFLMARVGGLESKGGGPSFTTVTLFAKEEMTVQRNHEERDRFLDVDVVDDVGVGITASSSGFAFRACLS